MEYSVAAVCVLCSVAAASAAGSTATSGLVLFYIYIAISTYSHIHTLVHSLCIYFTARSIYMSNAL